MNSKQEVLKQLDKQKLLILSTIKGLELSSLTPQEIVTRLNNLGLINEQITKYVTTEH